MTRVALLGATGSIGRQALEIVAASPELELVAATSGSTPIEGLAPLTQVGGDPTELLERAEPDVVLNAIVGFAGIRATLWALERGVTLALANKESLVAAGELATAARTRGGGALLPVDSEHSATLQCLEGRDPEQIHSLVITASGGPFRGRTRAELADVTVEEALAHPTWAMGPKITIDSSTLMNKGLEVIEAHELFGVPYDRIDVVVHPQAVVHSMVTFIDGSTIAQASPPDMRLPIALALGWPDRVADAARPCTWDAPQAWTFEPLDDDAFAGVRLARQAGEAGGCLPAVFNAANEEAVAAFVAGGLGFLDLTAVVADTLAAADGWRADPATVADVVAAEEWARAHAGEVVHAALSGRV